MNITIRTAGFPDMAGVQRIYAHAVLHTTGTFEEVPPKEDEMERRRATIVAEKYPYLVALVDDQVIGFAYGSSFRQRAAYRFTVEDTVYVDPDWQGRGVGRALLARLIEDCTTLGFRQMVAVIGGTENLGSIGLHQGQGFTDAGQFQHVGLKFDQWVGVAFLQRTLGEGSSTIPPE